MRGVKLIKSGQICEIRVTEVKVVKLIKCMKLKYEKYNKRNITGNDIRGYRGHACIFLLLQNYISG